MKALIPQEKTRELVAEGYDDASLHDIFAFPEVKLAQSGGAEVMFEPFKPAVTTSSLSLTASSPDLRSQQKKWWQPFSSKKRVVQLAPMLVVVIAMNRPVKANHVSVVDTTPVSHVMQASVGEYIQPEVRYPVLMKAIEKGRLAEAGRPDPRRRKLRTIAEPESLTEAQQIAFGKLGDPPAEHARRPRLV